MLHNHSCKLQGFNIFRTEKIVLVFPSKSVYVWTEWRVPGILGTSLLNYFFILTFWSAVNLYLLKLISFKKILISLCSYKVLYICGRFITWPTGAKRFACSLTAKKIFQSTYSGLFIYMLCRSLRPNRKLGNSMWKSTWSFANGNGLLYVNFSSAKFSKYPSEKRSE